MYGRLKTFENIIEHNTEVIKDSRINLVVHGKVHTHQMIRKSSKIKFINGYFSLIIRFTGLLFKDTYIDFFV